MGPSVGETSHCRSQVTLNHLDTVNELDRGAHFRPFSFTLCPSWCFFIDSPPFKIKQNMQGGFVATNRFVDTVHENLAEVAYMNVRKIMTYCTVFVFMHSFNLVVAFCLLKLIK